MSTIIVAHPRHAAGRLDATEAVAILVDEPHERASGSSLASGRHEIVTSHIDSVVSAIVLALDRGEARRRYYMFDDADPAWPSMTTSTRGQ